MANSVFIGQPFSSNGANLVVNTGLGITIDPTQKYGFTGVGNAIALNAGATAVQASDGGNYFYVAAGVVTINSALLALASGGTAAANLSNGGVSGQFNMLNAGSTAGIGVDVATDAVFKLRTRAQTGYATLDCLGLKSSGAAGASGTGTVLTALTVVNGIVTAITIS